MYDKKKMEVFCLKPVNKLNTTTTRIHLLYFFIFRVTL